MKPTYNNFEAKKSGGYIELPPVGAYIAEIQDVRVAKNEKTGRDIIELMIEITEGEYKNRYHDVYDDQSERFGKATYKGTFRLTPYVSGDEDWVRNKFEGNLWCVQESNPGYKWDWDEKKLKGKKVGINVRKRLYTYNGKNRETTEIGQFETIADVKAGKVKQLKDRDNRENKTESAETDGSDFTDVSKDVEVPFPTW